VLEHQQRQRPQREPEAEVEADQPRADELIDVQEGADGAQYEPAEADGERPRLEFCQRRRIGNDCLSRHTVFRT
jgi:hypothetical protein